MNKNKIIQQLRKAKEAKYIHSFLENDFDCTQDCDECPARETCEQLSNNGDYKVFIANYRALKLYKEFNHDS